MNIKNISSLYLESHAVTHAATRLRGDLRVNAIIDNRLLRESDYVRKQSVTVRSEAVYQQALNYNCVQGKVPTVSSESPVPPQEFVDEIKKDVKISVTFDENIPFSAM